MMGCRRINADPCINLKCTGIVRLIYLSWIGDCECFGKDDEVEKSSNEMMDLFDCDDVVNMNEYVGCKINVDDGFTFTQLVILQSFRDDFSLPKQVPTTLAIATPVKTLENPWKRMLNHLKRRQTFVRERGNFSA